MKKVSVIIPVYNAAQYIERCLNSILSQTYENMEVILVDDGSSDESGAICDRFALQDNRIVVIHKLNGGVSSARNAGLNAANGDYIGFIDADDYIEPEMYTTLVEQIEEDEADIAICGFANEVAPGKFEAYCKGIFQGVLSQREQIEFLLQNKFFTCACWDKLFRKELVSDIRFSEKITHYEDLLFLYQVMKKSKRASYSSVPMYNYTSNIGSAAQSPFSDKKMSMIDVWDFIYRDVKEILPESKTIAQNEYVRNNLMCALFAAKSNYANQDSINRIRKNVKRYLLFFLFSDMALGYKVQAVCLSISWNLFNRYVR